MAPKVAPESGSECGSVQVAPKSGSMSGSQKSGSFHKAPRFDGFERKVQFLSVYGMLRGTIIQAQAQDVCS